MWKMLITDKFSMNYYKYGRNMAFYGYYGLIWQLSYLRHKTGFADAALCFGGYSSLVCRHPSHFGKRMSILRANSYANGNKATVGF